MNLSFIKIEGDKTVWAMSLLLAIASFMPVYSAATNIALGQGGTTVGAILFKHSLHIVTGLFFMYIVHRVPISKVQKIIPLLFIGSFILVLVTMFSGTKVGGVSASRWIQIPMIGSLQPSSIAWVVLMISLAWVLSKMDENKFSFNKTILTIWLPIFLIVGPIFPHNLSTAALIIAMSFVVLFVGNYPVKYLAKVLFGMIFIGTIGFFTAKAFPEIMPDRMNTWVARINRYGAEEKEQQDRYQIDNAKIAIANGNISGQGPGKSIQKNVLPQSSSDFIFAIICEEYGFIGGTVIIFFYSVLFFRFLVISNKARDSFSKIMVVGLGFSIIIQAIVNMGVAVEIFPTTGQPLPLISTGGSFIWMTFISIGLIIGVSRTDEQLKRQLKEDEKKQAEFKRILEEQQVASEGENPIAAVMK